MTNNKIPDEEADEIVLELLKKHPAEIVVNIEDFLDLLKHSLSLSGSEKQRVVDRASTLSQFQFDELKRILTEEREKFKKLAEKHPKDIEKLIEKQKREWLEVINESVVHSRKHVSQNALTP